ncbi:LPS export ABC transporter permease LptF [Oceanicoccus sagamiensis]|uniref:Lipopolysaccharide export system permease protein LptF n=1 Tax=Oceanicoccus sagamiensis TaxID=716816 RepID=A0A1X9NKK7_9GAMM|nr:LPS export ABC transporter permease LptF [Oceanicoccus sagamiensis]ARN75377.1 LPS export ABC transporter permease LptF [Oceanicoccus sagamiensis]
MILFRYLAREIFITMVAVTATLLVIVMSGRFVKYLAQAASGDLAPDVVFSIMAYRLPSFLELVLPLGLFIAILLAYGRLYVESEMTVMSACGLSTRRLALYTLVPSAFVALLVAWLSLSVSPAGIAKVQEIFEDAKNSSGLELLVAGRFRLDEKSGRVTYIERMDDGRQVMEEVFSAEQSRAREGGKKLSVVLAERGTIQNVEQHNARYLVLENGFQYTGKPGSQEFRVTAFEQFGQLVKEPELQRNSYKKADARSTEQLMASDDLEDKATLQWRISLGILVPIIALIAQALSKTSHRRGRYVKMLPAFLIYIVYVVSLNAARDGIEKEKIPLELGMWWVHGIFLLIALGLLFGADGWRRLRASAAKPVDTVAGQ